jgi:hypothetical protein
MSPVQWALRKCGNTEKDRECETVEIQYGGKKARNARHSSAAGFSASKG